MQKRGQHHISAQRAIDFANDRIELTDVEARHFDRCDTCKIAVRHILRASARLRSTLQLQSTRRRGRFSRVA
jgi:hypothetical protein